MFEVIPAIDLIGGKCVRLAQGDFSQSKIYSENPLETAKRFEAAGFKRVHIVDLDGAKNGKIANLKVLEEIAGGTDLTIDFGGGIRTRGDLESVFNAGASAASVGSVAATDPSGFAGWVDQYGPDKFLLGADVRNGKISISGWQTDTKLEINKFLASNIAVGVDRVFVTDISKDGLLQGPAIELYKGILQNMPDLKLIASGGVGSVSDVADLEKIGCRGVIIGKALYEGRIKLEELTRYVG